ncbi:hypothetical protein [Micromonospora rubida]|uniref:hypothetical protein n=1 Tax=Micromonospora rubida TaxID=2697657 RepID=UPI001377992E|nr:hypothetical protein [Micromonospora rubida]NBE80117.1 hypothetical protein [Micromonospora rubida]
MSGSIEFSGDALAQRVPLLGQFRTDLENTLTPLVDIAACRWAAGAPADDEFTMQVREAVRKMMAEYVLPAYVQLGESVGLQGDKLDLVRRIGEQTESGNSEIAGGWGGGSRHG